MLIDIKDLSPLPIQNIARLCKDDRGWSRMLIIRITFHLFSSSVGGGLLFCSKALKKHLFFLEMATEFLNAVRVCPWVFYTTGSVRPFPWFFRVTSTYVRHTDH